jgi:hypothetical protein
LTATGADTRRWTAVVDRDELGEIADRAVDDTSSGGSRWDSTSFARSSSR